MTVRDFINVEEVIPLVHSQKQKNFQIEKYIFFLIKGQEIFAITVTKLHLNKHSQCIRFAALLLSKHYMFQMTIQ